MLGDLENDPTLVGPDGFGELAGFHREHLVFKLLRERPALEVFQVAALGGRGTRGVGFRDFRKFLSALKLRVNRVGFRLSLGH